MIFYLFVSRFFIFWGGTLKTKELFICIFFLSDFFSPLNLLCPYSFPSYSHPKLSSISQGDTSQTKLYCICLLCTANQFVYISHKLSQENGPHEDNFYLHFSSLKPTPVLADLELFGEHGRFFPSSFARVFIASFLSSSYCAQLVLKADQLLIVCQKNSWLVLDIFHICAVNQVIPGLIEAFLEVLKLMFALPCALFCQPEEMRSPGHLLLMYPPCPPLWPFPNEDLNLPQWCPGERSKVSAKTYTGKKVQH